MVIMDEPTLRAEVEKLVQNYPDFPSEGILFRDFLPLFARPKLVRSLCQFIADRYRGQVDVVAALEARGFLLGPIVAMNLDVPFVPIRKQGKLPGPVSSASYKKEYGVDVIEMQRGLIGEGQRVLLIDDLLATGGSLRAAEQLLAGVNAKVAAIFVLIELSKLGGRNQLQATVDSLIKYQD